MKYSVRVKSPGKETKYDDFETNDVEKYDETEADARSAYASAVKEYDMFTEVAILRDGVVLDNAYGTGDSSLPDAEPEKGEVPVRDRVVEGGGTLLRVESDSDADTEPESNVVDDAPASLTPGQPDDVSDGLYDQNEEKDRFVTPDEPDQSVNLDK